MTNPFLFLGTQEIVIVFIVAVVATVPLVLIILALIDVFKRNFGDKTSDRIMLLILKLLVPILGSIIYFVALRKPYPLKA